MNRIDRLVAVVMYLQGRRLVRAEELASHFEVSVRTVYRDVAALGEAGVPIAGEAGVGYSLVKGYHLPPVMFTGDEAAALVLGAELVHHWTDASMRGPTQSAVDKLRAVLPRDRQDQMERLARATLVAEPSRPPAAGEPPSWFCQVQTATMQRRVLDIFYRSGDGSESTRSVEPLGIMFDDGRWYVIAWCRLRQAVRNFRVDRIGRLTLRPETFAPRQDFSLRRYVDESRRQYPPTRVRVWFARAAQERARAQSATPLVEEQSRDGGAVFSFATFSLEWLALWVLSFGGDAEVIEPAALRDKVRAAADKAAARHRGSVESEA